MDHKNSAEPFNTTISRNRNNSLTRLPSGGTKLYDTRDYGHDFELRCEQPNGTVVETAKKSFA